MTFKNILIVDDSNGQNQSCYQDLKSEGFEVSVLNSLEDALKGEHKPQLVILDLKLHGEDSFKLIEKFKTQNIPLILCSEWGKDKMSFPIWASHVKVVKSGDHRDLKLTIKEILG
ncbi:MAG: response regulator [Nitrospinae bacterium]|nr:response regulator [Nitrospinota bacterium]